MQNLKLKRAEYLSAVLKKFLNTEPKLSLEEVAEILVMEIEDIESFLRKYKKQKKKNN